MITYVDTPTKTTVKLDKRVVGHIKKVPGGWQYFPKGQKTGGEVMSSLGKVKHSLENED